MRSYNLTILCKNLARNIKSTVLRAVERFLATFGMTKSARDDGQDGFPGTLIYTDLQYLLEPFGHLITSNICAPAFRNSYKIKTF